MESLHRTTLLLLLVTIVIGAAATGESHQQCRQFSCHKENGLFGHPSSCTKYVKCMFGTSYIKSCPANLHYDPQSEMCTFGRLAKCNQAEKDAHKTCALVGLSSVAEEEETLDAVARSASKEHGSHESGSKEHGSHESGSKEHGSHEQGSHEHGSHEHGSHEEGSHEHGSHEEGSHEDGGDQDDDDLAPGVVCDCGICCRKPDPFDCTSFFYCDAKGNAHKKTCADGLVYNPVNEECDLPANYECPQLPTCHCKCRYPVNGECEAFYKCEEVGATVIKEYCTEGLIFNPETEMCDFPGNVDCPPKPPPTSNPDECKDHEADCETWAASGQCKCDTDHDSDCSWQTYVTLNCRLSCNLCGTPVTTVKPTKPPVTTVKPTKPPVKPTTESSSGESGENCDIDCSQGQYHRHATDCTKFMQCTPSGPVAMPCGPETRWDQDILTCNHKAVTPCVVGNGDCVKTIPDDDTPVGPCDIVCPQPNGEFAHPRDCRKWVHCSNNIAYVKDCPASLFFDATLKACNWPEDTVCIADEDSDCVVPIIPTPTPNPDDDDVIPPDVCDCECCLRPHPEDCQSYYYCDGSNTEFHTCSEGLVFDPEMETCVYAEDYPECVIVPPPVCECECLYPSPICTQYFKCVDNVPEKLECPNQLYYNPDTHACDKPENVDCTPPTSKRFINRAQAPAPISALDCKRVPDGRYAAKDNPQAFFHCAKGVAFLLRCQEGFTFSATTSKCILK